jgi:hypothetical protein
MGFETFPYSLFACNWHVVALYINTGITNVYFNIKRRGYRMKKICLFILIVVIGFMGFSCASIEGMSDTTKGAAIGAGLGAIAGQIIGGNTAGTLIGVAGGALAGALVGHEMDYQKEKSAQSQKPVYTSADPQQQPPGQWVEVPGQWIGGKWVPAHKAWVPVNP